MCAIQCIGLRFSIHPTKCIVHGWQGSNRVTGESRQVGQIGCLKSCRVTKYLGYESTSASFFKIKLNYFLDTLIQILFFQIMKINNFRGDLNDISAKKEALESTVHVDEQGSDALKLSDSEALN